MKKPAFNLMDQAMQHRAVLLMILVVAAGLRLYRINYDLPFLYDQDEPIYVTLALRMLKYRDLNPHWFGNPAGPLLYLLAFIFALVFLVGLALGVFSSPADFGQYYYSNPTLFYIIGRLVSVVAALGSIYLTYLIGTTLFGSTSGLVAAALLSVSPVHFSLSRLVRVDSLMTFLLLLAFWYTLKILKNRDWSSYLSAGFISGIAIVTKYPAVVFTATIALAHFFTAPMLRSKQHWKLLASAAACVVAAFIGCPFLFLGFRAALADISHEARTEHLGASGEGFLQNLFWYIKLPLPDALSPTGFVLAMIGIVLLMSSRRRDGWLLLSFPLLFIPFISSLGLRWERWILPAIPFLCIIVSYAFIKLLAFVASRTNERIAVICAILILTMTIWPLLKGTVGAVSAISNPNTITLSREWLLNHAPPRSRILIETYGPQLPADLFTIIVIEDRGNLAETKSPYTNRQPEWRIAELENLDEIRTQQIEFVVMSGNYEELLREREKYPAQLAKYTELMNWGPLVFDSNTIPIATRGRRIRIFRLNRRTAGSS